MCSRSTHTRMYEDQCEQHDITSVGFYTMLFGRKSYSDFGPPPALKAHPSRAKRDEHTGRVHMYKRMFLSEWETQTQSFNSLRLVGVCAKLHFKLSLGGNFGAACFWSVFQQKHFLEWDTLDMSTFLKRPMTASWLEGALYSSRTTRSISHMCGYT